jgi:orotate phosphoribosyltransferase
MARTMVDDLSLDERAELIDLLRSQGIVYSSADRPVVDRQGNRRPWGLYTPSFTLTGRGMLLAARALSARLATFRSTQIAGFGFTAMPLLSGCVMLGQGTYTGLIIRDRPKEYLTRRRIDGPGDPRIPVVVVDDSISSGTSLFRAIKALEAEGFEVEGAVALVRFPYQGGAEWAYGHGYRVDSVFDVWHDIGMAATKNTDPAQPLDITEGACPIESGLNPAVAARRIAEAYLADGVPPRPPDRFDAIYDGRGGVWVSFRVRGSEHRVAREGFWHFDPQRAAPGRDLVAATVKTIEKSKGGVSLEQLARLKIAVTFFNPLEPITPAQLDFDRYGIVVRDTATGWKLGGALPNTQVFVSEVAQYLHACKRNAGLASGEPHELFRHDVVKVVEPGEEWLPYGIPDGKELAWANDISIGQALVGRARVVAGVANEHDGRLQALSDDLVPYRLYGVAVGIYRQGRSALGVSLATGPQRYSLDTLLCRAVRTAVRDAIDESSTIVITLLHDPEHHGSHAGVAASKLRRGRDCLVAGAGGKHVVALQTAIPYSNISRRELVHSVGANAAQLGGTTRWTTYRTSAWIGGRDRVRPMAFGFPRPEADSDDQASIIELLAQHIVTGLDAEGLPTYYLDPVRGAASRTGTSARLISALAALDAAGRRQGREEWVAAARPGLLNCLNHVADSSGALALPGQHNDILADCLLLAGAAEAVTTCSGHPAIPRLAARVSALLRPDGRICLRPVRLARRQDHDFLPGAAILAMATAASAGLITLDPDTVESCLRWQRQRFRLLRSWGMAGWQPQAWAAMWELTGDRDQAGFVFEVADWTTERQLQKTGAFLEDLAYEEPTFNTAFVAEAVAAAWRVADRMGDTSHRDRYRRSWQMAMRFIRTLVISPDDTFCMKDPKHAVGGVRTSITRSDIRVDAVSHALRAAVAGEKV